VQLEEQRIKSREMKVMEETKLQHVELELVREKFRLMQQEMRIIMMMH